MWRSFLIAVRFLTRLPLPSSGAETGHDVERSVLFYPVVGLIIGMLLWAATGLISHVDSELRAALILAVWVVLTGALHLDGLADTADAWVGGLGSRERTLAIMKDPCSGPAAVVALVLVLLIKFAALKELLTQNDAAALLLAPIIGRTAVLVLFLTTPYVRPSGIGAALARNLPRRATVVVVAGAVAVMALLGGRAAIWPLSAAALLFIGLRAWMIRRIDGMTGDTAGALVELTECAVLVAQAFMATAAR